VTVILDTLKFFTYKNQIVILPNDLIPFLEIGYKRLMTSFELKKKKGIFTKGFDYLKITGKDLVELKVILQSRGINTKYISHSILFTTKGVIKIAKYIQTDKSWKLLNMVDFT